MIDSHKNYKQIDDIIDERKKLGQYNVGKQPGAVNYRYAYSSSSAATPTSHDKYNRFDDAVMFEGDFFNPDLKHTDSEVTVVRVRCNALNAKRRSSKWNMHDIAIPGDGSHLGESPSMVNLATLVQQNDEYLVPLSSWDPYYVDEHVICDDDKFSQEDICQTSSSQLSKENSLESKTSSNGQRQSLAGRISKFLRRHCRRSKTLPEPYNYQPNEKSPRI